MATSRKTSLATAKMPPETVDDLCAKGAARLLSAKATTTEATPEKMMTRRLPITRVVQLLVFFDMLSVSLVLSLLPSYFGDLNIR